MTRTRRHSHLAGPPQRPRSRCGQTSDPSERANEALARPGRSRRGRAYYRSTVPSVYGRWYFWYRNPTEESASARLRAGANHMDLNRQTSAGTDTAHRVLCGWDYRPCQSRRVRPSGWSRKPDGPAIARRTVGCRDRLVVHPSHARVVSVVFVVRERVVRGLRLREERRIGGEFALSAQVAVWRDCHVRAGRRLIPPLVVAFCQG